MKVGGQPHAPAVLPRGRASDSRCIGWTPRQCGRSGGFRRWNVTLVNFQFLDFVNWLVLQKLHCFIIISFVIPVVFIYKLDWSVCTCLIEFYLMVEICTEFTTQRTTTCFGTWQWLSSGWEMKQNLVSSYTRLMWDVYSGDVRSEVSTRSRMCYVGWVVWIHGFCYYKPM